MDNDNFPNYPLRRINRDIWQACKVRAMQDGITVRDVIDCALQTYAKTGLAGIGGGAKPTRKKVN